MNTISTINVPFHGDNLYLVNYEGQPFVAMRPFIEGMGLDWASQYTKIKQRFKTCVVNITMQLPCDNQRRSVVCLALKKLTGWLHTININKVKPEIREKVAAYQDRSDDVLYEYWTTGEVKAKKSTTTDDRAPLRNAVDCLMTKKRLSFPKAYGYVHAKYGVNSIDEVPLDLLPEAVDYIYKVALEGEYIPKQQLPQIGLESLAMPMSFFDDFDWLFEEENISKNEALSHADAYPRCMLKTAPEYPNPVGVLLNKLQSAGVDVSAAQIQLRALRNHLRATIMQLDIASRKDTKTLLSNTNVAFNHLKAIREEWRTTLAPAIEKLNPNLEYEVTRRLAEMNGIIYANLMSLQGTKSGKLLA
ncbi:phage antirepressor N-terminal domain-containing protein [Providencia rettgeri]|uniref:phage antirepressor N-terminal domain-containing protein n=1 Tax=Providencia rettgeri TaxID=587 RepID=UPI00313BC9BB